MADSINHEREFHDHVWSGETRNAAAPFYAITGSSKDHYRRLVMDDCAGKEVLEFGCGRGGSVLGLARSGARAIGIDVSTEGLQRGSRAARSEGLDRAGFVEMDAHRLAFPDDSFDRVCGSGILHHLDLPEAIPEMVRVLRPSGRAIFYEPMGHNPIINWFRHRTPGLRTSDEHPLLMPDLDIIRDQFSSVHTRFFHLTALAAVPVRRLRLFPSLRASLDGLDETLFRWIPPLRRHAWVVVIDGSDPVKV